MKSSIITLSAVESLRAEAAAESKNNLRVHLVKCVQHDMPYKALRLSPCYTRVTVGNDGVKKSAPAVVLPSRLTSDYIAINLPAAVAVESASIALYRSAMTYYKALVGAAEEQPSFSDVKKCFYSWARAMLGEGFAGTPSDVRTALHTVLRIKTSKEDDHVYELSKVTPAAVESAFWAVIVESSWRVIEPDKIKTPAKKAAAIIEEKERKQRERAAKDERVLAAKTAAEAAAEKAEADKKAAAEAAQTERIEFAACIESALGSRDEATVAAAKPSREADRALKQAELTSCSADSQAADEADKKIAELRKQSVAADVKAINALVYSADSYVAELAKKAVIATKTAVKLYKIAEKSAAAAEAAQKELEIVRKNNVK